MTDSLGLSLDVWAGAILGALVIPGVLQIGKSLAGWWIALRPPRQVLGPLASNDEACTIFVRDFFLDKDSKLTSVEPRVGVGIVPNVRELWSEADGRGVSYVFNALGQVDKRQNISIVRMGQDTGIWDTNLVVMGAQAQKCFDSYQRLQGVM